MKSEYLVSSRDYLGRALLRLQDSAPESLFYAALELRCGIEARMREYLETWDHISNRKKQGWKITELGKSIEHVFKTGSKVVRLAVLEKRTGSPKVVFYHTPVTPELRKHGVLMGNYLHSTKAAGGMSDRWWEDFRILLEKAAQGLRVANTGSLLGPPLLSSSGKLEMVTELPPTWDPESVRSFLSPNAHCALDVKYLVELPETPESGAALWPGGLRE